MTRDPYPQHGRRRTWYAPWRVTCRCGLDAYPCIVLRQQQAATQTRQAAEATYSDGLRYASGWRDSERRNWSGGAW